MKKRAVKAEEKKKATIYAKSRHELLTTCCGAAPIFYKSGRALCSLCGDGIDKGVYGIISHPKYESVSRADNAEPRNSNLRAGLQLGGKEIKSKRGLKPLSRQKDLIK